ncbi:hypothetical protein ACIQCD_18915 [Streptomyces sp. NPDC093250]|uniref:hypothetical protein n=1 Tax=unclassified Streptomyces TaxID=2593676 RepID=UPI0033D75FE4
MSTGARRIVAWLVGAVCLAVVIWLVVTAVLDLPTGDSTASVVGAVVAVIGLGLSGITLLRTSGSTGPGPVRVRARGTGTIAAGGDVRGNAVGARAKVTGATGTPAGGRPARGERDVRARGTGAIGAGGDIADNALGEDSER